MLTKEKIIDVLKTIKYPGFSRDIISFGLVKNIEISDNSINLFLSLKSNNGDVVKELEEKIHNIIKKELFVDDIKINIDLSDMEPSSQKSRIEGIKKIIAVGSAKGGVGKSTIAINIASQLSKGNAVGFLDLDIYGPSLPLMIGVDRAPEIIGQKLIPIEKYNMKLMSFGFLNQADSPAIWRGPMVAKLTNQFFDNVDWGDLDYLVIDLPPGTGDIQLTLAQKLSLDGIVMVTTPQELSLQDVRKGSEMFRKVNVPILGIVENMSKISIPGKFIPNKELESLGGKIIIDNKEFLVNRDGSFKFEYNIFDGPGGISESNRLDVPLLGKILLDQRLCSSGDNGTPFVFEHSNSSIADEFQKIEILIEKELNA
tara:strand:- start:1713 stop:2822 length:1110 start_codon:yes stop_codon:yes gene_type:complete